MAAYSAASTARTATAIRSSHSSSEARVESRRDIWSVFVGVVGEYRLARTDSRREAAGGRGGVSSAAARGGGQFAGAVTGEGRRRDASAPSPIWPRRPSPQQ